MTVLLPSFIADGNWFLLALLLPVTALVVLLHPRWRVYFGDISKRSRKRWYLLLGLLIFSSILAVLGVLLEIYHSRGCPNSAIFHYEIENLARFVYELCGRQNVPYWVAFGNLLFVMRGQRRIPVGDTDSDIGILKTDFISQFGSFTNFSKIVKKEAYLELQRPVFVLYHRERELIQLYLDKETKGSHADIWLYRQEVDEKTDIKWLVNDDRTIRSKWLLYDQILPLYEKPAFFLNVPVTIPRNPSYLANAEYGRNYMTPITMRMECIENIVNGYTFYKTSLVTKLRYATIFIALVAGVTVLAANCISPLKRALRMKTGAKADALEATERGSDKYYV
ncbi:unnamed protein product [Peronospora farinosa]|uniref:Uncharacterized protein n=1 Tax=Peronospora farinosa TaxID=134698 RepID=A0ABN8CJU9_9STRA|nr:unnamed protein product [Peronospora farinosa]